MKKIFLFVFTFVFVLCFAQSIHAQDIKNDIVSSIDDELSQFKDSVPQYVQDFLPENVLDGDFDSLLEGEIDEKSFLELASSYLIAGIDTALKNFASVLVLILISGIFNTVSHSLSESNISQVFSVCSSLCMAISVFNLCNTLAVNVTEYISALCNVMNSFAPIMATLLVMGGNISSAAVSNGSMMLFISIVESFLLTFMLPLTRICLAFGCVRSLGSNCDFGGIAKTVKTTFTSVTVFVMSVFMFVLSYKNILSQSVDSISIKTARFAISSFVPLVGSSINEALRTVTSSLSLIKNSCGILAIIIIVVILLPMVINLFLNKLSFGLLSSIAKLLGATNESAVLEEADSVCGFLMTLVCCTCVLFIFALTIFIKTGIEIK